MRSTKLLIFLAVALSSGMYAQDISVVTAPDNQEQPTQSVLRTMTIVSATNKLIGNLISKGADQEHCAALLQNLSIITKDLLAIQDKQSQTPHHILQQLRALLTEYAALRARCNK